MTNKKFIAILEGIVILVLGILIAVLGVNDVMNNYIAIVFIIIGTCLVSFSGYLLFRRQPLPFAPLALGAALITIAIGVFVGYVNFAMLINIIHFALTGAGAALICYGIFTAVKYNGPYGMAQSLMGGAIFALCLCYYFIADFKGPFWVIVGIVIAIVGGLSIIFAIFDKNNKSKE